VTIVGAGPVGLALGVFLHSYQIPCQIIEAKVAHFERTEEQKKMSRCVAIHARTTEILKFSGVSRRFLEEGLKLRGLRVNSVVIPLLPLVEETEFPFVLSLSQFNSESILLEECMKRGIKIHWNEKLTEITQDQDSVTLTVEGKDGTHKSYRSAYVVACDGAHSPIRHSLQIPFEGEDIDKLFIMGDGHITIDDNADTFMARPTQLDVNGVKYATVQAFIPQPGNIYRYLIEYPYELKDTVPDIITEEYLQQIIDVANPGLSYKFTSAGWLTKFYIRQRLAKNYRVGRIFLAGDAAHTHSPVGGQGMNTGIHDVAQLSWKLAYAIKNRVKNPEALLDTYEEERRAIGEAVVGASGSATRVIGANWIEPLVNLFSTLTRILPEGSTLPILRALSQIAIHYQSTSLSVQSPVTLEEFFKSPLEVTSEVLGTKLNAGSRVPHGFISTLSTPEQPKTIYTLFEEHFTKVVLFYLGSNTQRAQELINYIAAHYSDFIDAIAIYPSKSEAENAATAIPEQQLYYDANGMITSQFHGWDIVLIRPDCYIEYLGRPTQDISIFTKFLEGFYQQQK
jgi:2-polyprenyl-6-methoxyphenol hydroxylase-like FAD-dependent oxidoreductase